MREVREKGNGEQPVVVLVLVEEKEHMFISPNLCL
jgi:hypothetical protein